VHQVGDQPRSLLQVRASTSSNRIAIQRVLLFEGSTSTGFHFTFVHKYLKSWQTATLQRKAKMYGRRIKKAHHNIWQKQTAAPIRNTQPTKCALMYLYEY